MQTVRIAAAAVLAAVLAGSSMALARGGLGGAHFGGGGRMSGGFGGGLHAGGGFDRGGMNIDRGAINRGGMNIDRGAINRGGMNVDRARPARNEIAGRGPGGRATQGQLENFLGLPSDGGLAAHRAAQLPAHTGIGARPAGMRPAERAPAQRAARVRPGERPYHGYRPGRDVNWKTTINTYHVNINRSFYGYAYRGHLGCYPFGPSWWRVYPGPAWTVFGPVARAAALVSFGTLWRWCWPGGVVVDPVPYDYGDTIIYEGNTVYVTNQPVCTGKEYYQQAAGIAQSGSVAVSNDKDDWLDVGTFSVVPPDGSNAVAAVQLGINKNGVVRGNWFDMSSSENHIIKGSVDKQTQRVAWTVADTGEVCETGLDNLTKPESPLLVHYDADTSETMYLVFMKGQEDSQAGSDQ
jgi:hypothetical protein